MSKCIRPTKRQWSGALRLAVACAVVLAWSSFASAQTTASAVPFFATQAVGGVLIDANGVLNKAKPDDLSKVRNGWAQQMQPIPAGLNDNVQMRKVSLRQIAAVLEDCAKNNKPIPDAAMFLAGLQRIHYVFVYPEQKDIVLVGPGEGWKVDGTGNVVGVTTGLPVMMLDDLLTALRSAKAAAQGGIDCSIDPTPEGMVRLKKVGAPRADSAEEAQAAGEAYAAALGMQQISIRGVPDTSHFASVLVAADYRMKRIAMAFDPSPVRGLPSYMQMISGGGHGMRTPRWWLEPQCEVLRDPDGLAWDLRNSSVKCLTEEDVAAANGTFRHTGKASPAAQKWADLMTDKYPELAAADPIFGQLHNCMDLAVVAAMIVKERLTEKAGDGLPVLMDSSSVTTGVFHAPKQTESISSWVKKGRNWLVSTSGGVKINSWAIADKARRSDSVAGIRAKSAAADGAAWWWN